jgi:uncharacterized membrane protein YkvA (DUF1232 family)
MGDGDTAMAVVLGFIALILLSFLVLLAICIFVIYRYRVPLRGIAAMAGALVYLVSPVDALPEVALGPFGLVDDVGVVGAVGIFVYRLIQSRRALGGTAEPGPASPPVPPAGRGSAR